MARRVRTSADVGRFPLPQARCPAPFLTHIKAAERRRAMMGAKSARLQLA
jgi:hypothetical protein